ncbi:MAG TPA: hypothetical protein DDW20_03300 [Firmicutes bacterium]|uniref:hypothetical protein n=1 Tax=uncultured Treponema sp. TaxID=162155 RepID=UPI000E9A30F8|nr:hypothetical protein [uncultured Treponema sp.]HBF68328.1 hypothetical protein [Bacillota bacterium]
MSLEKESLDENAKDKFLEITKSSITTVCSFIPFIGTGIAEVINYFIPDNRRERVVNFIKELAGYISKHDKKIIELQQWLEKIKANKKSSLLFENAIFYSMQTESKIKHHCYAFYVFNAIENSSISDIQKEQVLRSISLLNETEILLLIYLGHDRFLFEESDFHKKYTDYIDRHSACGDEDDKIFNAMQDSYLNNLVVYGIASAKDDPKKGPSSFYLLPYGHIVYDAVFDEEYFR